MNLEAENALFALFAVKLGLVSEAHVERALGKLEDGQRLADKLVEAGRIHPEDVARVGQSANAEVFPGYRIEGEAGRGGMGVVYRARQRKLDRPVALKLVSPNLTTDRDFSQRFAREARAMARLAHPGIVGVHDFGDRDGEAEVARLQHPRGITFAREDVFVADTFNGKIKRVSLMGFGVATIARGLQHPGGLTVCGDHLLIADTDGHRVMALHVGSGELRPLRLQGLA